MVDRGRLYAGIKRSLGIGGYLIFLEPVLDRRAFVEEERHPWVEQGLMIREELLYVRELENQGFNIIFEKRWKKTIAASDDIKVYVAKLSN